MACAAGHIDSCCVGASNGLPGCRKRSRGQHGAARDAGVGAAAHRAGAGRRWCQGRGARRGHHPARRHAHPRRLRRWHEHGRTGRRDLCGRNDRCGSGAGDRQDFLGTDHRLRGAPRKAADAAQAGRPDLQQYPRVRLPGRRDRPAARFRQHAEYRADDPLPRRTQPGHEQLRRPADPVPRHCDGHDDGRDGRARPRRPRPGDAREYRRARRLFTGKDRWPHARRRRPDAQRAGGHRATDLRRCRDRRGGADPAAAGRRPAIAADDDLALARRADRRQRKGAARHARPAGREDHRADG